MKALLSRIHGGFYNWLHKREIKENMRLCFYLARQDLIIDDMHRYIFHLKDEMRKFFRAPVLPLNPKASVENVTPINRNVVDIHFDERWRVMLPVNFKEFAQDTRREWIQDAAQMATKDLEAKLTQVILKKLEK